MAKKRNKRVIIDDLLITQIASEGRGMGHHEGKVIFVDYAVPGDIVQVQTTINKKDYAIASILKIIQPAAYRQQSICEHFGVCGGCRWLHVPYDKQLEFKQELVEEIFKRIGKLTYPKINAILGAPDVYHYRNKTEYSFTQKGWLTQDQIESEENIDRRALGYHVPGRFDGIVHINHCYLQDSLGDSIRLFIYQYAVQHQLTFYDLRNHVGFLRTLILRNNLAGEWMVTLSFAEDHPEDIRNLLSAIKNNFNQITSLNFVINNKKNDTLYGLEVQNFDGNPFLIEQLGDLKFKIGPKSFFQTNSKQGKNLYDVVARMTQIQHSDTIYDLYTGTGSIALYVAQSAHQVIGIETVEEAISDARFNMELNGIQNTQFISASVEKILDQDFITLHGKPDIVISDPPRMGMHQDVVDILLQTAPRQIIYVSCNPATQARDLSLLAEKYEIIEIQPVDMFPNTYHIENVVNLQLKSHSNPL